MRRLREPLGIATVLAAICVAVALVRVLLDGPQRWVVSNPVVVLCAAAIVFGEMRRTTSDERSAAPISVGAGLALALAPIHDGEDAIRSADVILVVGVALAVAALLRAAFGPRLPSPDLVARLLSVAATAYLVHVGPTSIFTWSMASDVSKGLIAVVLVLASAVGVIVEMTVRSWLRASAFHIPLRVVLRDAVTGGGGLALSVLATGPLVALVEPVIHAWAVPLCLTPLLLAQFAVRREEGTRRTYRETIATLSRLTDVTGYTPSGHARRVAQTSVDVGRELGLAQRELDELEYAALLHDLGQIALRVAIPGGATVLAAPADQRRIADDGALIVRRTGVLDDVAHVIERQTTPYRQVREFGEELPMASRIIKVVNAYDDLTEAAGGGPQGHDAALERIHLGLGYEYDPAVVDALHRVLTRRLAST
ncbi:putative lipoprotein [Nostocoides japonicum T1-X7]|uniref:Putative lipoprotein n=1 Tax=Nostocoides japonicum T1-X7 TaxID=1194083 RepID=A0A077M3X9_9MICO|nr:HD domain-containing phosphohydrolase [Tetrasphaera japonica]CCH79752.1 putative lipoprotein [Tetrasphaera japonica T1-X7]